MNNAEMMIKEVIETTCRYRGMEIPKDVDSIARRTWLACGPDEEKIVNFLAAHFGDPQR